MVAEGCCVAIVFADLMVGCVEERCAVGAHKKSFDIEGFMPKRIIA
jgi:hypothetical protein